jgi:transposase
MHVRVSSVSRRGRTYQYAQLVESVRRQRDGQPIHRVVANLGRITDPVQLDNLKAAFAANRSGERLVPVVASAPEPAAAAARPRRPQAILDYLDVAVVVETLRQLGLTDELARLLPQAGSEVAPDRIVEALVVHRCLEPESKLQAVRWFPHTALPELLGVSPAQFNNTRLHRVLEQLEQVEPELMRAVSRCCHEQHGRFATLFLDVTDTWFVGDGPELAKRGRVKEGMVRQKIGIVLLCSEQGHPLRWEVLEGASAEGPAMLGVMRTVQRVPWLQRIPIVCDRALGYNAYIAELLDAKVRFVTALIAPEFDSYGVELPAANFADLPVARLRDELPQCTAEAAARARQSPELQRLSDTLFIKDLGIVNCPTDETQIKDTRTTSSGALRIAEALEESKACGKFVTYAAAARTVGLSPQRGIQYRALLRLDADLRQQVQEGRVDGHSLDRVRKVAQLGDPQQQREAFAELLREVPSYHAPTAPSAAASLTQQQAERPKPKRVRCVLYFNPQIFARQRWTAQTKVDAVLSTVQKLNAQLAQPRTRLEPKHARRRVEDKLRHHDLLTAFHIETESVEVAGRTCAQLRVALDPVQWRQRRSTDGFTVLVAHPELKCTAAELSQSYRAKSAVEHDFHVIKSVVKLRPVRHRTDVKVRAHVALCMLALAVERELTLRLQKEGISAEQALKQLRPIRLSLHTSRNARSDTYVLPQIGARELQLLRRLGLMRLADERELVAALTPRSEFGSTEPTETA